MKIIKIKTESKNYEINLGHNFLRSIPIKKLINNKDIFIIFDKKVPEARLIDFEKNLKRSNAKKIQTFKISATENNKNFSYLSKIYDFLIKNNFSRDCLIIGIGGGITCDITGFVASTFLRGVDFVLIPTTLLSQVDASIGGKTGVNHKGFKNMIGTFNQPLKVIIDTKFLNSLSKLEILCGFMEILKHGLIADRKFFLWLEKNLAKILSLSPQFIEKAIKRSIEIKAEIVFQDEKEKGLRAILNFGHTFGHALETAGENKIYSHGEAVGLGMLTATKLSEFVLGLEEKYSNSIYKVIKNSGMKVNLKQKVSTKKLIKLMQSDKKKKDGEIQFILLEKIGQATIKKVKKIDLVEKAIKKSLFY